MARAPKKYFFVENIYSLISFRRKKILISLKNEINEKIFILKVVNEFNESTNKIFVDFSKFSTNFNKFQRTLVVFPSFLGKILDLLEILIDSLKFSLNSLKFSLIR